MRQKHSDRHRVERETHGDPTPIDLTDTARQLALFETGNGWPYGVIEVLFALLAAFMFVPLRSFIRSGFRDRR